MDSRTTPDSDKDIRFKEVEVGTLSEHLIETCNESGESIVWVRF